MEQYKQDFSVVIADSGALFFKKGGFLKDGRDTEIFYNSGVLNVDPQYRWQAAKAYAAMIQHKMKNGFEITKIFGPAYKGITIAADVTMALYLNHSIKLPFFHDRKEVKMHGEGSIGGSKFLGPPLRDGDLIYILDDVGTSMTTKESSIDDIAQESLIKGINTRIIGVGIALDREQAEPVYDSAIPALSDEALFEWKKAHVVDGARGDDAKAKFEDKHHFEIDAIAGVNEAVEFLYEYKHPLMIDGVKRPLSKEEYVRFQKYMEKYCVRRWKK